MGQVNIPLPILTPILELKDLIWGLLKRDKNERLGSKGGADEIIAHPWFKGLDWEEIKSKKAQTPYVPPLENYGLDNFDEMFINEDIKNDAEDMSTIDMSFDNIYTGKVLFGHLGLDFSYEYSQSSGTEMEDWKF